MSALIHDEMVIGAGTAGTGKTYLAARIAGRLYTKSKNFTHLILTRPNIEVGKSLGFLPGELNEKFAPYIEPFSKALHDELGTKFKADLHKSIKCEPIAYMRGKTYDNAIILLDEAQNTTIEELKVILTRIGTGSRLFITGDDTNGQNDLRVKENGLQWLIRQIKQQNMNIEVVQFNSNDCVRSGLCKKLLKMIENEV